LGVQDWGSEVKHGSNLLGDLSSEPDCLSFEMKGLSNQMQWGCSELGDLRSRLKGLSQTVNDANVAGEVALLEACSSQFAGE
jgi:hypothetical protein